MELKKNQEVEELDSQASPEIKQMFGTLREENIGIINAAKDIGKHKLLEKIEEESEEVGKITEEDTRDLKQLYERLEENIQNSQKANIEMKMKNHLEETSKFSELFLEDDKIIKLSAEIAWKRHNAFKEIGFTGEESILLVAASIKSN